MEEMENTQSDVQQSTEQVSSSEQAASSAPAQEDTGTQASAPQEQNTPFHQHPRFQELIQQKRELSDRVSTYEQRMAEMQRQVEAMQSSAPKAEDPLLARLKQIDPEFGARFEKLSSLESQVEKFKEWQQEQVMESYRTQASQSLTDLYKQYSVPENMQKRYDREIKAIAYENPNLGLKDLPEVFKSVHEEFTKWQDEFKRKERESYVTEKSAAKTPGTVTGGSAPSQSKVAGSGEKGMSKQDVIDQFVKEFRASKQKI